MSNAFVLRFSCEDDLAAPGRPVVSVSVAVAAYPNDLIYTVFGHEAHHVRVVMLDRNLWNARLLRDLIRELRRVEKRMKVSCDGLRFASCQRQKVTGCVFLELKCLKRLYVTDMLGHVGASLKHET